MSSSDIYAYAINLQDNESTPVKIINQVGHHKTVLELGCSSGHMTRILKENFDCRVIGIEIDPESAEQARSYCEKIIIGDVEQINLLEELSDLQFDTIICADVLEHLTDPWKLVKTLTSKLAPNGSIIISVPNAGFHGVLSELCDAKFSYRSKGSLDQNHLRFFTEYELEVLLLSCGLMPKNWDYALLGAEHSEFADSWRKLSTEQQQFLRSRKNSEAYQIIVSSCIPEKSDWDNFLKAKEESEFLLQQANREQEKLLQQYETDKNRIQTEYANQISQLETRIAESMTESKNQIESWQKKAQQFKHQAESLEQQLRHIYHSKIWKLSRVFYILLRIPVHLKTLSLSLLFLTRNTHLIRYAVQEIKQSYMNSGWRAALIKIRDYRKSFYSGKQRLWERYQTDLNELKASFQTIAQNLPHKPLISVIIPTYQTQEPILIDTINSVVHQVYEHWELIICDDASNTPHIEKLLQQFSEQDSRIRYLINPVNTGVSATSNRAIEAAQGEFIVLLDHDDTLMPHALLRVAQSIINDQADFIYSDEALVAEDGERLIDFAFRPAFSLEFLRNHPYIVHLIAFKKELFNRVGGFDTELTISQDYDLILKLCEQAQTVVHIPEVLYCWRQITTSSGHDQKNKVSTTSTKILQSHLNRCHLNALAYKSTDFNFYDIQYTLDPKIKVAIIIPTKNYADLVKQCIDSIEKTVKSVDYHIVVIDHDSDQHESIEYFNSLAESGHTVLKYEGDFNFSKINNWAVNQLSENFTHYLLCNNDIEAITDNWLELMAELASQDDVGIVGATLLYPDENTIQHGGVTVGLFGAAEHNGKFLSLYYPDGQKFPGYRGALIANHEMSAVTAACLLISQNAFQSIEGFDEKLAVGFGDVDLCLRVRNAGYRIVLCNKAILIHHESITRGKSTSDPHPADSAFFVQRWETLIKQTDPFYNPNLTDVATNWSYHSPLPIKADFKRRISRLNQLKEISLQTQTQ